MSLYGALFGGVSGLSGQSSKIGIISDNIANVNTVGYKQAVANFQSLVVNSDSNVNYQTGGVRGGTHLAISKQGLLASSESPTDLAISGNGFFVVRGVADASVGGTAATPYYTRAGSFTQDSLGNFVNAQGFFLQGWPLDRDGRLPGAPGNLNTIAFTNFDSLKPVNVESASGIAQSTTTVDIGANLKASEVIYPGEAGTLKPDINTTNNRNLASDKVLVSSEYGLASANSVRRGDVFQVLTGNGLQYDYEYGGYTVGRDITTVGGSTNYGDSQTSNTTPITLPANSLAYTAVSQTYTLTLPSPMNLTNGDTVTLSGYAAIGATTAAQLNAAHVITVTGANTVTFSVGTAPGITGSGGPAGATAATRQFQGNVLDAVTSTQAFLGQTGTTGFTSAALTLTVTTATTGTVTFTYTNSSPNTLSGQFNSLSSLASAIDSVNGLTARVTGGRLVVSSEDASEAVTFANGDAVGNGSITAPKRGLDWKTELGLADVAVGNRRYNSIAGLAKLVNADDGVSAKITDPLSNASIAINVDDPRDTIQFLDVQTVSNFTSTAGITTTAGTYTAGSSIDVVFNDAPPASLLVGDFINLSGLANGFAGLPGILPNGGPYEVTASTAGSYTVRMTAPYAITIAGTTTGASAAGNVISVQGKSNQGSILSQFGLLASLNNAVYVPVAAGTGVLGPKYDPSGTIGENMASGDITAQFSRNVRIYDSLGTGHDLRMSFLKIATNDWVMELHAIPETDVSTPLVNGQVLTAEVSFNGDGTLKFVKGISGSVDDIEINWTNGAIASNITLNLGTAGQPFGTLGATAIGLSDGLSQFDSAYNVNFANQNGAPVGQLTSVAIDKEGIVIASYSNGQTQELFKLPLASFANPDGLNPVSGNIFSQTRDSGEVNLREAGTNGTGSIVAAALEQSNTDLAEQLTDMIVAQRSYQANTKVIKTADELLQALTQL